MEVSTFEDHNYGNLLSTVNVIEMSEVNEDTLSIRSFPDNKLGNMNAEDLFKKMVLENDKDVSEEDIQYAIEDGIYSTGKWACYIIHSS